MQVVKEDFVICQGGQMYRVYYKDDFVVDNLTYTKDLKEFYRSCGFLVVGT